MGHDDCTDARIHVFVSLGGQFRVMGMMTFCKLRVSEFWSDPIRVGVLLDIQCIEYGCLNSYVKDCVFSCLYTIRQYRNELVSSSV